MESDHNQIKNRLKELFSVQRFAVLSTQTGGKPYANLMAFASTEDLDQIIFLTSRMTKKYHALIAGPDIALLIDSRSNSVSDIQNAIAVTVTGVAGEIKDSERTGLMALFLNKHPYMADFARSPETALFSLKAATFYIVSSFRNVAVWKPYSENSNN